MGYPTYCWKREPSVPKNAFIKDLESATDYDDSIILVNHHLGPYFSSLDFPATLQNLIPFDTKEKMLVTTKAEDWDMITWCTDQSLRSWPKSDDKWVTWHERLQSVYTPIWKSAEIEVLFNFSLNPIPMDRGLIAAAYCFWSSSANCFMFPCGPMTPTILDIVSLLGCRGFGETMDPLVVPEPDFDFDVSKANSAWGTYMSSVRGDDCTAPTDQEHRGFLLMFLSRYLLCNTVGQMTSEYKELAKMLSIGKPMNFAPYLLAILYRGMNELVVNSNRFCNVGAPLWILQLWLWAYFPEIAPIAKSSDGDKSYGMKWLKAEPKFRPFKEYMQFFLTLSIDRHQRCFNPFVTRQYGPDWFRLQTPDHDEHNQEFLASCLTPRDLAFGGPLYLKHSRNGVEFYCPCYVARQFGFTQDVPAPVYLYSLNFSVSRVFCNEKDFTTLRKTFDLNWPENKLTNFGVWPHLSDNFQSWWPKIFKERICADVTTAIPRLIPDEAYVIKMARGPFAKGRQSFGPPAGKSKGKATSSKASKVGVSKASPAPKIIPIVAIPLATLPPVSSRSRSKRSAETPLYSESYERRPKKPTLDVKSPRKLLLKNTEDQQESDDEDLQEISKDEAMGLSTPTATETTDGASITKETHDTTAPGSEAESSKIPLIKTVVYESLKVVSMNSNISVFAGTVDETPEQPIIIETPLPEPAEKIEDLLQDMEKLLDMTPFQLSDPGSISHHEPLTSLQLKLQKMIDQGFEVTLSSTDLDDFFEVITVMKQHPEASEELKGKLVIFDEMFAKVPTFQTIAKAQVEVDVYMQKMAQLQQELVRLNADYTTKHAPVAEAHKVINSTQEELIQVRLDIEKLKAREVELQGVIHKASKDKLAADEELTITQKAIRTLGTQVKVHTMNIEPMRQANERYIRMHKTMADLWTRASHVLQ